MTLNCSLTLIIKRQLLMASISYPTLQSISACITSTVNGSVMHAADGTINFNPLTSSALSKQAIFLFNNYLVHCRIKHSREWQQRVRYPLKCALKKEETADTASLAPKEFSGWCGTTVK